MVAAIDDGPQPMEAGMEAGTLFEETIEVERGHQRLMIKVELGEAGAIQVVLQGHGGPTVSYRFNDPDDALAVGRALVQAAEVARRAGGMETG